MKKILLVVLFLFSQITHSNEVLITLATINNIPISNKDLSDEILVLNTLNKTREVNQNLLKKIAFKNLINDTLMNLEIEKKKISSNKENIKKIYNNFLTEVGKEKKISPVIKNKILNKIRLQENWNSLIIKIYYQKINIDINEIEKKIKDLGYKDFNDSKVMTLKKKMMSDKRDKKFNMYSAKHLNIIKKEHLIKIFK
jgi:hypothetical protein